jgi:hypothetical protein
MEITKRVERNSIMSFILAVVAAVLIGVGFSSVKTDSFTADMPYELEGRR